MPTDAGANKREAKIAKANNDVEVKLEQIEGVEVMLILRTVTKEASPLTLIQYHTPKGMRKQREGFRGTETVTKRFSGTTE